MDKPFRQIIESDLSDEAKLELVANAFDEVAEGSPYFAFLVDALCYAFERIDVAEKQIALLADLLQRVTDAANTLADEMDKR